MAERVIDSLLFGCDLFSWSGKGLLGLFIRLNLDIEDCKGVQFIKLLEGK